MRIEHILESEEDDQVYREKAREVYTKIAKNLPALPISSFRKVRVSGAQGFLVHCTKVGVDDDFDIVIGQKPEDVPDATGGYDMNTDRLFLFFNMSKPLSSQLSSRDMKRTIVHELIHRYDNERTDYERSTTDKSEDEYYNSDDEMNAYYQEAISEIENVLNRLQSLGREDVISSQWYPFETFKRKAFKENFDIAFVRNMNDKTQRKVTKRLYRFWTNKVEPLIGEERQ